MANLTGAPAAAPFPTSQFKTTTEHGGAGLGQRFCDKDGNEFILVDCQEAFIAGEVCVIGPDWQASQVTSTSRGRVGVICSAPTASDTYAFAQVFGTYSGALATSGVTSAGLLFAPVTTDGGYFDQGTTTTANTVHGAWSRSAASTATSPAAGGALIDVQLNYPYVLGIADAILMTS
jgi:hypothetical protein